MTDQTNTPAAILMGGELTKPAPESKPAPADAAPRTEWNLPPAVLHEMAASEIKAGRLTEAQAAEMLAADGVTGSAPALDDEAAKPADYQFPNAEGVEYGPKEFETDMKLRTWLSEAKFPREIGSSLAAEASSVLKYYNSLSPESRELYRREQAALLRRVWGDKFDANVTLARQLLTELDAKQPGALDFVDQSGLGDSASIIAMLHQQAERLAAKGTK